jgi:hypothetical protein
MINPCNTNPTLLYPGVDMPVGQPNQQLGPVQCSFTNASGTTTVYGDTAQAQALCGDEGQRSPQSQQPQTNTCWYQDKTGYVAVRVQNAPSCLSHVTVGNVPYTEVTGEPANMEGTATECTRTFSNGSSDTVYTTLPGFWEVSATCAALNS